MKTYTVIFAEDVPHYGTAEIRAGNDADAIKAAKDLKWIAAGAVLSVNSSPRFIFGKPKCLVIENKNFCA